MMNINFNTIINFLQEVNQRFAITSLFEEREVGHILNQQELITVLIILVVGLLWCFAGHLMVRFWAALLGFGLGFVLGAMLGSLFAFGGLILAISGGVLGLIFGIFSARILPLGTFLVVLLSIFALTALLLRADNFMILGISLAVALVFAILSFKFPAPIVIVVTSICGALISGETLGILVNYNLLIYMVVVVALAVGGMCTQFLFENGKRKRQHLERVNEIKDSKAEDIERARNLMDVLEDEPKVEILWDEGTEEEDKKEKSKTEKPKKEKPKKGKKDQIQIVFDNIEDDEEFNFKSGSTENFTFDGGSEDKKLKEEDPGTLSQEKTETTGDSVASTKNESTTVAGIQEEKGDEGEEREGKTEFTKEWEEKKEKSKPAKVPEVEEEREEADEDSALKRPKKEKPEENYIVKNIQVEEEVERKATELERAKRDWINQLVSDKPKDENQE